MRNFEIQSKFITNNNCWKHCYLSNTGLILDEDDNLNNSTPKEDAGKALAATLGSIEVTEDSPLLRKNANIPTIQTAINSDQDLTPDEEMNLPIK